MYETIQTPFNYGGLTLKNRIIFAPTTFGLSDEDYFEKIRRIAAGGCAMIIVGDVPVGKSHFGKSLFDKKGFAFYEKVIGIAHDNDCKVCAQLHQSVLPVFRIEVECQPYQHRSRNHAETDTYPLVDTNHVKDDEQHEHRQ